MNRSLPALLLVLALSLSGCGLNGFSGLYSTPLPGGADLGADPYHVTVQFHDALDLVPQAAVKVNDVAVGKVESIDIAPDNRTALVRVAVNRGARLPANASAQLRQSSLLGEKFVELTEPAAAPGGQLGNGSVVPVDRTNRNPEIEEVLGALSLLLNGGDVGKVQTIVGELNAALSGNEAQVRSVLDQTQKLTADLDAQKENIVHALDALNRVSATFSAQRTDIANTLDHMQPGVQVLNQQREQLVQMLSAMNRLSGVAVDTVGKSKQDLVADLRSLDPTLRRLADTGKNLVPAVNYLQTYPFPPDATRTLRGDYFNADIFVDLDLSSVVENMIKAQPQLPAAPQPPPVPMPLSPVPLPPTPQLPNPQLPTPQLPKPPPGGGGLLGSLFGGS